MIRAPSRLARLVAVVALTGGAFAAPALGGTLFIVSGGGSGHGVGMSQWGAEGYALHGAGYRQILAHYYPETTLATVGDRPVRVLLGTGRARVAVGSRAPFLLVDARGRTVHVRAGTLAFTTRLRLGRTPLVPPVAIRAGAQPLTLDGIAYRGSLTLTRADGGLAAVSTLPLERYLRAVVPSEMPKGWRPDAYAAQAVAARSFVLASLTPDRPFDVYADARSQVYGGIAGERSDTNRAVAATAGQALSYAGRVIHAFYDSSSGGRTAAVEDAFAGAQPVPYLVSVADPYDSVGPDHHWRLALTGAELGTRLGVAVDDVLVTHDGSGLADRIELMAAHGGRTLTGQELARALGLKSARFSLAVLALDDPVRQVPAAKPATLGGFVRRAGGVVLQEQLPSGAWRQVARIHPRANGRFTATVRPKRTTVYRLAVDRTPGPPVRLEVTRSAPR